MSDEMSEVEQAKELLRRVKVALKVIGNPVSVFTDNQILFRAEALEGMLIMAINDIGYIARKWKEIKETDWKAIATAEIEKHGKVFAEEVRAMNEPCKEAIAKAVDEER